MLGSEAANFVPTHGYTHIHAYVYARLCTCLHPYLYTGRYACLCTCQCTCLNIYYSSTNVRPVHAHVFGHVYTHVYTHGYTHCHMHACVHDNTRQKHISHTEQPKCFRSHAVDHSFGWPPEPWPSNTVRCGVVLSDPSYTSRSTKSSARCWGKRTRLSWAQTNYISRDTAPQPDHISHGPTHGPTALQHGPTAL